MTRAVLFVFVLICITAFEVLMVSGESYYDGGNEDSRSMSIEDDKIPIRNPADKRSSSIYVHRLSCIRRGGACDHRPNDCCFSSSCRCNLWGSNCRCQRVGLFQKWG